VATGQRHEVRGEGGQRELEVREEADVEHLQPVTALDVRRTDVPQLGRAVRLQAQLHLPRIRGTAARHAAVPQLVGHRVGLELDAVLGKDGEHAVKEGRVHGRRARAHGAAARSAGRPEHAARQAEQHARGMAGIFSDRSASTLL